MSDPKHIHWSELYMPFNRGISPLMLHGEGEKVETTTRLKGVAASRSSRYHVIVTYDKEYVIEYLARILSAMVVVKWNDLQPIISAAIKLAKSRS